jgi:hypothetical protein
MLSEVQEIVYGGGSAGVRKINPATGMPPYLVTTEGTRNYNCPADCRITNAIFRDSPLSHYSAAQDRAGYEEYLWGGRRRYRLATSQTEATEGVLATVTFVDDPGDTTTTLYHDYFIKATPLDTEQVELTLPGHTHFMMREAVISMLRSEGYGPSGFDIEMIERVARKIRNALNRGAQPRAMKTPWQPDYLDYPSG